MPRVNKSVSRFQVSTYLNGIFGSRLIQACMLAMWLRSQSIATKTNFLIAQTVDPGPHTAENWLNLGQIRVSENMYIFVVETNMVQSVPMGLARADQVIGERSRGPFPQTSN